MNDSPNETDTADAAVSPSLAASSSLPSITVLLHIIAKLAPSRSIAMLVLIGAHSIVQAAFAVASGLLIGAVPAAVASGTLLSPAGHHLWLWLGVASGLFVLLQLSEPFLEALFDSLGRYVDRGLRLKLVEIVNQPAEIGHFEDPSVLDRIRDAQRIGAADFTPGSAVRGICSNLRQRLNTVASALLIAQFRWWLGVVLLAFGWVARSRAIKGTASRHATASSRLPELRRSDYIRDLALLRAAAKETRVFGMRGWLLERFSAEWLSAMARIRRRREAERSKLWAWNVAWGAVTVGALLFVGHAAVHGEVSVGELAIYAQAAFGASAVWLGEDDLRVAYGAASIPALVELENMLAPKQSVSAPTTVKKPRVSIEFESVAFRYPGQNIDVYHNLNMSIRAGQSLAIVGANGVGKTTLVKLLAGMCRPTRGRIVADGIDIRDFDQKKWQRQFAVIFQDFVRYPMSARDNVTLGALERLGDQQALLHVAEQVGVRAAMEALPRSWETTLSPEFDNGVDLSGGQWQRLALARALFAARGPAGVLVLDEPTANLDARSEAEFMDQFLVLTRGLTTILISHRFSSVRRADRIAVLAEGRIVEEGSHAELLGLRGAYAEMFKLQASRFVDEQSVDIGTLREQSPHA